MYRNTILALAILAAGVGPLAPAQAVAAEARAAATADAVVYFADDSDEISAESAKLLDGIAARFAASGKKWLVIEGHTDLVEGGDPSPEYGFGLSQRRAANVRSYLWDHGVEGNTMSTLAMSQDRPADAGKRRRVELYFSDDRR